MLPTIETELLEDFTVTTKPSLTYQLDIDHSRMEPDRIEGLKAVKQAVYKILLTERYQYPIYSWDYGIETVDLYGKPISYVRPELERRVREALLQDDRITSVDNFTIETPERNTLTATFTVSTIFGGFDTVKAVTV